MAEKQTATKKAPTKKPVARKPQHGPRDVKYWQKRFCESRDRHIANAESLIRMAESTIAGAREDIETYRKNTCYCRVCLPCGEIRDNPVRGTWNFCHVCGTKDTEVDLKGGRKAVRHE